MKASRRDDHSALGEEGLPRAITSPNFCDETLARASKTSFDPAGGGGSRDLVRRLALALAIPTTLIAQQPDSAGSRVRVWAPEARITARIGTTVSLTQDTLLVRFENERVPIGLPALSVTRIETRGPAPRAFGAVRGAAIGVIVGIAAGLAIGYVTDRESSSNGCRDGTCVKVLLPVVLSVPGALLGGALGARKPYDRWSEANLPGSAFGGTQGNLSTRAAHTRSPVRLLPGMRIRTSIAESGVPSSEGVLRSLRGDTLLVLVNDAEIMIGLEQMRSLEIASGSPSRTTGGWRGAMVGAGVGATTGYALSHPAGSVSGRLTDRLTNALLDAGLGGVIGFAAGTLFPVRHWINVIVGR
ncbi:MAG: hypothetical protein JWM41_475 [Gemmatimonadetes bacterium]|nr:hypothetical protein [Gemmatimonadota bacterium]